LGNSGINLFPVESIYGVIEVKTSVHSKDGLLKAVDQALEIKNLCKNSRDPRQKLPFTGVFLFESKVRGDILFDALKRRPPGERADFVLILDPADASNSNNSFYFAHWHYYSRGSRRIDFATAEEAAQERASDPPDPDKRLTFGETELGLLWFYMFLIKELDTMRLESLNLWIGKYTEVVKTHLGWRDNE
jgi:hypothetical protein